MKLAWLDDRLTICRLPPHEPWPDWLPNQGLVACVRTADELSVVCRTSAVPSGIQQERGWRAFRVVGVLEFSQTGILSSLAAPLAEAGISIFAMSTFDTDYLLVREQDVERASGALGSAGCEWMD